MAVQSFKRFVAIDWSGAKSQRTQRQAIVRGVVERVDGRLRVTTLEGCRDREEIVDWLAERAGDGVSTLVGLDFPFSYAIPFLDRLGVPDFSALLAYMVSLENGQAFVDTCGKWFRDGIHDRDHLTRRHVERLPRTRGAESPLRALPDGNGRYRFLGARQVGKAAITGIAAIARLKEKARSVRVWPLEDVEGAGFVLAEIWPRLALPGVVKSDRAHRKRYLTELAQRGIQLQPEHRGLAWESDHAIDALASGIEMAESWRLRDRRALPPESAREGWILGVEPPAVLAGSGGAGPRLRVSR